MLSVFICVELAEPMKKPHISGKILVHYKKSTLWNGHPFDIKIYRSNKLQLIFPNLNPGREAEFMLPSKLFFGIVFKNLTAGTVLKNPEDVKCATEVDLSCYLKGLKVTAEQLNPAEVSFNFTPLFS